MNLGILGYAPDVIVAAKSLIEAGHGIAYMGPYPQLDRISDREINDFCKRYSTEKVRSHDAILKKGVKNILLIHYPHLIEPRNLAKARHFNIHYALLPRYRGKHSLACAIINGEKEVGYSLHLVDEGMDSGPIYHQGKIKIDDSENINEIRERVLILIYDELGKRFKEIDGGKKPHPQDSSKATFVTGIRHRDCLINWSWPAETVFNYIRALMPPVMKGAYIYHKGTRVVLSKASRLRSHHKLSRPGTVIKILDKSIWVKCGDKPIQIDEIIKGDKKTAPSGIFSKEGLLLPGGR